MDFLAQHNFRVEYDDGGTIGRRYARADEIGVPISITVDYQTSKDGTVTLRDRDTWRQVRNPWKTIPEHVRSFLDGKLDFSDLGISVKTNYE